MPHLAPDATHRTASLQDQAWFAAVLVMYALVELSFNHRMLELTDVVLSNPDLDGLQFWCRVIAGFGLSMLLLRWLDLRMQQRWQAVVISFAVGMLVMWHFQKMVIDYLVDHAPAAEKKLSVYLLNSADLGAAGLLNIKGDALGKPDMAPSVREAVKTLLPATALGMTLSDFEAPATGWVSQPAALPLSASDEMLDNAYRNTITPPIALGIVENMAVHVCSQCGHAEHIFGHEGGKRMAQEFGMPYLGALPLDLSIRLQADSGKPTVVSVPAIYKAIARQVAVGIAAKAKDFSAKFPTITVSKDT